MAQGRAVQGEETTFDTAQRGSNQSGMRAFNERLVLSLIRQNGALPKAEIARRTGLSAQTVSVIFRALEADGLLLRGDPVRGKIGQPSVPFGLAAEGAFFFGLKVGRRTFDLVLTDFLGKVRHRARIGQAVPTPERVVAFAISAMGDLTLKLPPDQRARIAGLGIALPFQLWDWAEAQDPHTQDPQRHDPKTHRAETQSPEAAALNSWKNRDIGAEIAQHCDFPVFTCNDASTACGAELVFGTQDKPRDFLYVFVGFFVGGGLVLDNALYTGRTGNAAALGSVMVPAADGRLRQLVDVASLAVLERALAQSGGRSPLDWDRPQDWDIPRALSNPWLDAAARGIAHAIAASVCLIDVGQVLVDGAMPPQMRAALVGRIQTHLDAMTLAGVAKPAVAEGSIGPDARALGAASLPLAKRFLVERNSH